MRYLYNLLLYILLPFILLRLWWRSHKTPAYVKNWPQRFGFVTAQDNHPIWIHAVSFGEAKVATQLIQALRTTNPTLPIIVTNMTATGAQQIRETFGAQLSQAYVPYDYPSAIKRFLKRIQPRMLVIIETELWPNILFYTAQNQIPIVIANARLSERSTKGYQKLGTGFREILKNITAVLAQSETDAKHFAKIGVPEKNCHNVGNIKFDLSLPENILSQKEQLRQRLGSNRPIWIAASTHKGEEEIILVAQQKILKKIPNALLILVPRHPERFTEVEKLIEKYSLQVTRHTEAKENLAQTQVYLADVMGQLLLLYAASDIAFVGGSLIPQGGHNFIEPALIKLPIITGPHLQNFKTIAAQFRTQKLLNEVNNADELADCVINLFNNQTLREQQGNAAQQLVMQNQGALQKHVEWIKSILNTALSS